MEIRHTNGVYALLPYSDIHVRSAVHLLKFHNHPQAKKLLSTVLAHYLLQTIQKEYIMIPVPLSKKRQRQRGYNQVTEVIKEALLTLPTAKLEQQILIRTQHTIAQTSLSRAQRLTNVQNAFSIKNTRVAELKLAGRHVVLIDDVLTTGATLKAARKTLETCEPSSITCIALAH